MLRHQSRRNQTSPKTDFTLISPKCWAAFYGDIVGLEGASVLRSDQPVLATALLGAKWGYDKLQDILKKFPLVYSCSKFGSADLFGYPLSYDEGVFGQRYINFLLWYWLRFFRRMLLLEFTI